MISLFLFWVCIVAMFHSYVLFPLLLKYFSRGKKQNEIVFSSDAKDLPNLFLLMAAYNEERVIKEGLTSIFNTSYPLEKLHVFVGSDNSTDRTNEIVTELAKQFPQLKLLVYEGRNGKPNILNKLMKEAEKELVSGNEVLLFTDANILFTPSTIYEMVKHFRNEKIGLVGANILNKGMKEDGISFQENSYIQRENEIKFLEGLNWGTMIGAFGGGYSLRADCRVRVPANFIVDDFYVSMNVLSMDKRAILEPLAVCYEDVSNEMGNEFNRKARIQAGNFQNLAVYWQQLFRFNAVSFCFLSHKVIRWLGPLFILLTFVSNLLLIDTNSFYAFTFRLQCLLLISPVLDFLLRKINLHVSLLRFASYFIIMNLALIKGFLMFARGVKTNVWNRTERNID